MATSRWAAREQGSGSAASAQSSGRGTRVGAKTLGAGVVAVMTVASGLVLATAPGVAGASHAKVVKVGTATVPHVGVVLTTGSGLTLYHFLNNPPGQSTCTGACGKIWPPYLAPKGAHISGPRGVKGLSLVNVGNGHWQVAFHNTVLYRFEEDSKKGQAKGQGLIGKWFATMKSGIAAPAAAGPAATVPTSTTSAPPTTTQAPHAGTTSPPASQAPPPSAPATIPQAPPPPPPTAPPAPTTTIAPPTTTTTSGAGGGGGVGF
jgi:predicted lipoprotein with Yx(FWY)xxD motif